MSPSDLPAAGSVSSPGAGAVEACAPSTRRVDRCAVRTPAPVSTCFADAGGDRYSTPLLPVSRKRNDQRDHGWAASRRGADADFAGRAVPQDLSDGASRSGACCGARRRRDPPSCAGPRTWLSITSRPPDHGRCSQFPRPDVKRLLAQVCPASPGSRHGPTPVVLCRVMLDSCVPGDA